MAFLDFFSQGGPMGQGGGLSNLLGLGMGLMGLGGSLFSKPTFERFDTRTPEQMAGLSKLQNPPQWTSGDIESAAKLAAMSGAGSSAARGFMVPGGGQIGLPQTISSEEALRQIMGLKSQNISNQITGAQGLAQSPGYSFRQRPSVFSAASQAGTGFGRMLMPGMNPWQMGGNKPPEQQRPFNPEEAAG